MRAIQIIAAAALWAGCAAVGPGPGHDAGDRVGGGSSPEEYEELERLRENRIDPTLATAEELSAIPGFPSGLAERIARLRRMGYRGRRLHEHLTPPERGTLERFGEFLVLPGTRPLSLRSYGAGLSEGDEVERYDGRFELAGGSGRLLVRARHDRNGRSAAFFVRSPIWRHAVRCHAGDFLVDIGLGMQLGDDSFLYPFAPGYPAVTGRVFVARTGFYGRVLRGGGIEGWLGGARILLFAGYPRRFGGSGARTGHEPVGGARLEYTTLNGVVGLSASGRRDEQRLGLDAALDIDGMRIVMELRGGRGGPPAFAMGTRYERGTLHAGLRVHAVSRVSSEDCLRIPGIGAGSDGWHRGAGIVAGGRLPFGVAARLYAELSATGTGGDSGERELFRAELSRAAGSFDLALSAQHREDLRIDRIPSPAPAGTDRSVHRSIRALASFSGARWLSARLSLRWIEGEDSAGWLTAVSVLLRRPGLLELRPLVVGWRSTRGKQTFTHYEPELPGFHPWKRVSGAGLREGIVISVFHPPFRLGGRYLHERDGTAAGSMQIGFEF